MSLFNNNNLEITGLYPIISNNSNLVLDNNIISSQNLEIKKYNLSISIDSNINIKKTNKTANTPINMAATNNSKIYIQNYTPSKYSTTLTNNNIVNFPNLKYGVITELSDISSYTHGKIIFPSGISITVEENGIQNTYTSCNFGKQLINDGSVFKFYGKNIQDIIFPYKIISFNIIQKQIADQSALDNAISFIPRDLHQSKLLIKSGFTSIASTMSGLCFNLFGFYNGKIQLIKYQTYQSWNSFKFTNCENVYIHDFTGYFDTRNPNNNGNILFTFKNVKSAIIQDSNINSCINSKDSIYIDTINDLAVITYKQDILNEPLSTYGTLCCCDNSNLILKNNSINEYYQIPEYDYSQYKNISLFFIAKKNSTIVSNGNKFHFNKKKTNELQKRPILFYSAYNSKITANNDQVGYISQSNSLTYQYEYLTNQFDLNNDIQDSVLYGYELPGGIFNHNHSTHLLGIQQTLNKNLIDSDLPVGSIYNLQNKYTLFTGTGQNYSNQLISYKAAETSDSVMKLCLSNTDTYKQGIIYSVSANTSTYFQYSQKKPVNYYLKPTTYNTIVYSKYSENLFYFQKYYCIMSKGQFLVSDKTLTSDNVYDVLNNDTSNIIISSYIFNNFFENTGNTNKIIKYSQYTNYNKNIVTSSLIKPKLKE